VQSTIFRRPAAFALLAAAAVLLAALLIAPRAEAATIYACQKKKGGAIRIVGPKVKCKKKTEKTLKWNSSGTAGKNGKNGTNGSNGANGQNGANGTNGTNGAPGQPQKSLFFDVASDNGGFLSNIFTNVITVGDVSVRMACGNFIANILGIEATGPAGTRSQTGLVATRTDDTATQAQQTQVQRDDVTTNTSIGVLVTNTSGTLPNKASFTATIKSPTQVVFLHGYLEVGTAPSPTACQFQGSAFAIPV